MPLKQFNLKHFDFSNPAKADPIHGAGFKQLQLKTEPRVNAEHYYNTAMIKGSMKV